jgi:pimeloyl-ACP methyl ester carboxylesterase
VVPHIVRRIAATALLAACVAILAAAPGSARGTIRWHGCGSQLPASLDCGQLSVPLDYHHPRGQRITLGFVRLPASDRARRVGSLIINPGGPGGPGSVFVGIEAAGGHLWHPALHRRFDLIGMDPRGIGLSTPIRCDPAAYNKPVSLFPGTPAAFRQLATWARALGQSCRRLTGPLLGHVDTLSVARDMEALRRALGEGKLNFLGLSYGAQLGSLYAQRYPRHIRAMALDGIINHSISINTLFADATMAYEDTLNRFAAWCARARGCALHGQDVLALFDALVRQAEQRPLPAPRCAMASCRPTVTGADIRMNAFDMLLVKPPIPALGFRGWKGFAAALARAARGDGSAFSSHLATSPLDDPFAGLAVNCVDYPRELSSYEDLSAKMVLGRALAPHTQGAGETWLGLTGCMRWPVPLANPPRRIRIHGAPPILLVGATHDPSTAYVWAHGLRDQIPRSVLLTRDGDGHTSSWLGPDSRTNDAIVRYLITRKTPPPNSVYPD